MSGSPLELLQIADLAKQWPNLRPLHDSAMAQLMDMVPDAQKDLDARAQEKAKAEAEAEAKRQAAIKEQADKDAAALAAGKPKVIPATDPSLVDRRPA